MNLSFTYFNRFITQGRTVSTDSILLPVKIMPEPLEPLKQPIPAVCGPVKQAIPVKIPSRGEIIEKRASEIYAIRKEQEAEYLQWFDLLTRSNPTSVMAYLDRAIEKVKTGKSANRHETKRAQVKAFFKVDSSERMDISFDVFAENGTRRQGFDKLIMEVNPDIEIQEAVDLALFYWDLKQAGNLINRKECLVLATEELIGQENEEKAYYQSLKAESWGENPETPFINSQEPVQNRRSEPEGTSEYPSIHAVSNPIPCVESTGRVRSLLKSVGCIIFDTVEDFESYLDEIGENSTVIEGLDYETL